MVFAIQSWKSSLVVNMAMLLTSLSLLSPSVVALANYTQVGSDINGTAAFEQFGSVLSMSDDGNAIVVGAPFAFGSKGLVRVFQKDSNVSGMSNYIQVGEDIVGKASGDNFGRSVSMSGDGTSFVVGTPRSYRNNNGLAKGSVSVYRYRKYNDTGNFTQDGEDIVGKVSRDEFGSSVSMSGDGTSFVVGVPYSNNRNGSVSVHKYNTDTSNYEQVGEDIVGKATNAFFGLSVSMSRDGTSFVTGATGSNNNNGSVSVYKYSPTIGIYGKIGADVVGKESGGQFGAVVSMSEDGTSFVVGASRSFNSKGSVSVYDYNNGTSNYYQVGADIVGNVKDLFGTSVSMSDDGTSFVVGAKNQNNAPFFDYTSPGLVRLYKRNPTNGSYEKFGADIVGVKIGDEFGTSVSMSGNGGTVAVGAPLNDNVNGLNYGHVRLYVNTAIPTPAPTNAPTSAPTNAPTSAPTNTPTVAPSNTKFPTKSPTMVPSSAPTAAPTKSPLSTVASTTAPTKSPTKAPSGSAAPVVAPTDTPTLSPTGVPTAAPGPVVASFEFVFQLTNLPGILDANKSAVVLDACGQFFTEQIPEASNVTCALDDDRRRLQPRVLQNTVDVPVKVIAIFAPFYDASDFAEEILETVEANSTGFVTILQESSPEAGTFFANVVVDAIAPTSAPTVAPTNSPTKTPTRAPLTTESPSTTPSLNPVKASVPVTAAPVKAPIPTEAPVKTPIKAPTMPPVKVTTQAPTIAPVAAPTDATTKERCGLLGLSIFCPRPGKCGLLKRIINLGQC